MVDYGQSVVYLGVLKIGLLLLLVVPTVLAPSDGNVVDSPVSTVQQQNRFLSAETVREIRIAKEEMLTEMKAYQDENFQIFDGRMKGLVDDMLMKFILAGLGAFAAGGALVALFMQRSLKKFAIDRYVQLSAEGLSADAQGVAPQLNTLVNPGLEQMQQQEWHPQPESSSLGTVVGQEKASEMTQMNAWQAQPAYGGSWQSPVETTPEFSNVPYGYDDQKERNKEGELLTDPLDSPEWLGGTK